MPIKDAEKRKKAQRRAMRVHRTLCKSVKDIQLRHKSIGIDRESRDSVERLCNNCKIKGVCNYIREGDSRYIPLNTLTGILKGYSDVERQKFESFQKNILQTWGKTKNPKQRVNIIGHLLEGLTKIAFDGLGYEVFKAKYPLDFVAVGNWDIVICEDTNWKKTSFAEQDYFGRKHEALMVASKDGLIPLWIMTFREGLKQYNGLPDLELDSTIRTIEIKKQFLPDQVKYEDCKHLKHLIEKKLRRVVKNGQKA